MSSETSDPETGTERLRYCDEHKTPGERCPKCNTYSHCAKCDKCYEPGCSDG